MPEFDVFKKRGVHIAEAILAYLSNMAPETSVGLANLLAESAQKMWTAEIDKSKQNDWGEKYIEGLTIEPMRKAGEIARVFVDESSIAEGTKQKHIMFANIFEEGIRSWSIKEALLKSSKAHIGHNGLKHFHVPFRWRTPGSQKPSSSFAGVMPNEIYNLVKGGKITLKGDEYGKFAGLKKVNRDGQVAYMTWRTVSAKTEGWQYPNRSATPVYQKVLKQIDGMIDKVLITFCEAVLKEVQSNVG